MALLFIDGFDHYATADIGKKWASWNGSIYPTSGRRGGGAIALSNRYLNGSKIIPATSTVILGGAIKGGTPSANRYICAFNEGSTVHVSVILTTSNILEVWRWNGSSALVISSSAVTPNAWSYIELKAYIHDTAGTIDVRINGVSVGSATNVDTRNGGTTGQIDKIIIGDPGASASYDGYWDDLYICDGAGTTNNSFLGDCRIDTILPNGDGNYTQFTPSTGTSHYALVDESAPNTTDYNSSATSGDRDSYTFPALSSLSSQAIYGIQINAAALKSDAGARSLGTMSRLSGTNKDGSGSALGTSQTYISEIQETDPSSATWTQANVNAAEFGVKVTA